MDLKLRVAGDVLIVNLRGELDHHSAAEIKNDIMHEYSSKLCRDIIFDFSELYFMDSAGIGMLIGRYKQVCINGGSVYAVGVSPVIERIFELSGLNKIIKRYPTVEAAVNAVNVKEEVI